MQLNKYSKCIIFKYKIPEMSQDFNFVLKKIDFLFIYLVDSTYLNLNLSTAIFKKIFKK